MSCNETEKDWRIILKYSTISGQTPTIPLTDDHEDGTWLTTDIYVGEVFINSADGLAWFRSDDGIVPIAGTGGSASFIGDYVNISGGTFSGVVYAPTFSAAGVTASYIIADTFQGGTFDGTFTGDGSGLTGINANWLGGTISNPSQFLNDFTLTSNTYFDGPIGTNNSEIEIISNVNITGGAGVSASYFIGDGSLLTNIPVGTYSNTFTLSGSVSSYDIIFDRNDGSSYTVDLTSMFGTASNMTNAVWNSTNDELTLIFADGTNIVVPISVFNNISVYGAVNADEVYANNFYGTFNGTFSNDVYTISATLSGTDAIFTRTDGASYSLDLSSFTPGGGATPSLSDVLLAGNETGTNDIVLSDAGTGYSTEITGPTANLFNAAYKFNDIGGWVPRIETSYNNNTSFIQIEDSDTYISNRQTNLPSIDNQGLITVSPVIVELRNDDIVTGDFGTLKVNDYQVQHQVYNSTTNNTSILTQSEYENIMTTSIAGITPSGDVMSAYGRTWGNMAQIGSGLNATNTTQTMSANIEAQYDGSHIQNILTATDGTDSTGIVQRYYEIVTYGDVATFKGIQYLTDYSANYNGRSLVDKDYVDNSIASAPALDSSNSSDTLGYLSGAVQAPMYKMTRPFSSPSSGSVLYNGETIVMHTFRCAPGQLINSISFRINTAGAAGLGLAECRLVIYRSKLDANGNIIGGDLELDTGVSVNTLSAGTKVVSGLNHTLSSNTIQDIWWMGFRNYQTGTLSVKAAPTAAQVTLWAETTTSSIAMGRDDAWQWSVPWNAAMPTSAPTASAAVYTTTRVASLANGVLYCGISRT